MMPAHMTAPTAGGGSRLEPPAAPVPSPDDHALALHALLMAQVELYCDHDAAAVVALREAHRALLRDSCFAIAALASLDEAAWHIRHHEMREALRAITRARDSLA